MVTVALAPIAALAPIVSFAQAQEAGEGHHHHDSPPASRHYTRTQAIYQPPDVTLVDTSGVSVSLHEELRHDGPLLFQFIFTTCPAVCPALSSTFAAAQRLLDPQLVADSVRMVSVSIDPEHDTPERMREYAQRFAAGRQWHFLTGALDDVVAVQKAFGAYQGNKMRHQPLTFLHASPEAPWVRLDGFMSAADLVAEVRRLQPNAELGQRIYRQGILPSGQPVRGTIHGDIPVEGQAFACANCHRRSGFGTSEGGAYVPPVIGPALFRPREPDRGELFRELYQEVQPKKVVARVRDPRMRPAYSDESLATVLRRGRDPSGRHIDSLMPRYDFSDEDIGHLTAYLKTLGASPSPGVDDKRIHFATVVTEGADPEQRRAMLDVMEAYVRWKNADTRALQARPGHSLWHRDAFYTSYREWVLHIWEPRGEPSTWGGQLDTAYEKRPVFAVLGGLGQEDWRPVHEFCERTEVPCLFPNTNRPVVSRQGDYSLYLSKGRALEAQALGRFLGQRLKEDEAPTRIVQVFRESEASLARAFDGKLEDSERIKQIDRRIDNGTEMTAEFWRQMIRNEQPAVLVLWLKGADLPTRVPPSVREIYLSYSLLDELPAHVESYRDRLALTYPYALSGQPIPRIHRVRAWLRSRRVERREERLQLNTYFAFSIADHALMHLLESYSRDFFIESVEHEAENALNPGVYPHLSLGPGQRFASKGSYIVRSMGGAEERFEDLSGWIIP